MKALEVLKESDKARIALLLAFVLVLTYTEVVFLGFSLSPTTYNSGVTVNGPFGYTGRGISVLPVIDPAAAGAAIWPFKEIIVHILRFGKLPLWNPYNGAGMPLAADASVSSPYAPVEFLNFLPNSYWDFPVLMRLWLAGLFTYMYLRNLRLRRGPAFVGAVSYMLSGAFTWYATLNWLNVTMLTPLLLYFTDRLCAEPKPSNIVKFALALFASILGAHIESLILQTGVLVLYLIFRTLEPATTNRIKAIRGFIVAYGVGVGLSSFFLFPIFEFIMNGSLAHATGTGLTALDPRFSITSFIPYFFAELQQRSDVFSWDIFGGYVTSSILFLALLTFIPTDEHNREKRRVGIFFFAVAVIALLKSYGVPPVNWLGLLPVFDRILFPRFLGFVWTLGFSIAAAIGTDMLENKTTGRRAIIVSFLLTVVSLSLLAAWNTFFVLQHLSPVYTAARFVEAIAYAGVLASICLKRSALWTRITMGIIVMQVSLYVPLGMSYYWQFLRSLGFATVLFLVALVALFHTQKSSISGAALFQGPAVNRSRSPRWSRLNRTRLVVILVLAALIFQGILAASSPTGLPQRYDAFRPAPYLKFLQTHLANYRIYQFDGVLIPNFNGVFDIPSVEVYSAFNIGTFNRFAQTYLDTGMILTMFAGNQWFRNTGAPGAASQVQMNLDSYSFLGVKYFLAFQTDPNLAPDPIGGAVALPIGSQENAIGQSFTAIVNNMTGIGVQLGTYGRINPGTIVLTLDSIPYDIEYHRVSVVEAPKIVDDAYQMFYFAPILDSKGKSFYFSLQFRGYRPGNEVAVWTIPPNSPNLSISEQVVSGKMFLGGHAVDGSLAFTIDSKVFPLVYADKTARIYENPGVYPRAFIVHRYQTASSFEEAQDTLRSRNFNPREKVVLNVNPSESEVKALEQVPVTDKSSAEITKYEADKVVIRAHAEHAGLLILTDTFYPGWSAYVDGKAATIYEAYGLVRAVYLSQGEHMVEFVYFPRSFKIGLTISIASLIFMITLMWLSKRKPKIDLRRVAALGVGMTKSNGNML